MIYTLSLSLSFSLVLSFAQRDWGIEGQKSADEISVSGSGSSNNKKAAYPKSVDCTEKCTDCTYQFYCLLLFIWSPVNISNNNKSTSRRHSCFSCLCICCLFSDIIIIFFFMCRFWLICCLSFFLKLKNANALISSRSVLLSFFWMATFWWFCAERVPARFLFFYSPICFALAL